MDSELLIKVTNPELFALMIRVKAIYAVLGGDSGVKIDKKTMKAFDYKKAVLISRLVQLDNLAKDKKKLDASMPAESRDMIRMRNQMRFELTSVEDELKDLCKTAAADDKSNGKVSREEIAARKEVLETVKDEYYKVFEEITGTRHSGNKSSEQGGLGMSTLTKESLIAGTFAGAGMKMDREALSGENQQQLELIRNEVQDQDNILDEISKGLDDLKDAAERIGDELQHQDKMLSDLEAKTDKTQLSMDRVNEKSKEALAMLNDKSTNCCIYLICLAILGALGVITYQFISTKK